MRLLNCTPHDIIIVRPSDKGWSNLVLQPSGCLPRVEMTRRETTWIEDPDGYYVGVFENVPGAVTGLPDEDPGTALIVSRAVAEALPQRRDLFFPDDTVRDDKGRVVGCRALAQVPAPLLVEESAPKVTVDPESTYGPGELDRDPERKSDWGSAARAEWYRVNRRR